MRTDLKINYLELEIIAENIFKYMQTLMDIEYNLNQIGFCISTSDTFNGRPYTGLILNRFVKRQP